MYEHKTKCKQTKSYKESIKTRIRNSMKMSTATASATQRLTNNRLIMDSMATTTANEFMAAQTTCNNCYTRLFELKRQAIKIMMIEYHRMLKISPHALDSLPLLVYQNLQLNEHHLIGTVNGVCTYCGTHIESIKEHAVIQATFMTRNMPQSHNLLPYNNPANMGRPVASYGETTDSVNGKRVQGLNNTQHSSSSETRGGRDEPPARSTASPTAAQFFAEAAKKYNIPSKKKKKRHRREDDLFPTNFSYLLRTDPPPNPPGLFKYMGRRVDGKVSVMLRISPNTNLEETDSFIEVDQRRKQISVLQPKNLEHVPSKFQSFNSAPKLYAFDGIFEPDLSQTRVSSTSVLDVLHAVINGGEGCLLSYGASATGKTTTMVGSDNSNKDLGILPAAIAWLYSLLEDCKQRTGARISVRVSAVEVVGSTENLKDLLADQASGADSMDSTGDSPGVYLREDPIGGTVQLSNVSEPQAVSAEKAAFYLDAALAARTTETDESGQRQSSHMIFTVHVYQYRVERNHRRGPGGAVPYSGGRSRLHLIDLSHVNPNFRNIQHGGAPSHAALGQIIVAMLNGFKQVPYRDSKITRLLKDSIGNLTCRSTLITHVSADEKNYGKTYNTLQITSKINRSRRKRNKHCSSSSDNNSCDETGRRRRPYPAIVQTYGIDDNGLSSDYNTSSAGEDSCDTVIYMGSNGHLSDRDLTDNERPPSPDTFRAMRLKLASSSEDETNEPIELTSESAEETPLKRNKLEVLTNVIDAIPPLKIMETSNVEKAVNVVAPLVIKQENSTAASTISPSTDSTKTSLVNQLIESRNNDDIILMPNNDITDDVVDKIPSEKELRKREKRIAKLLKESLSNDDLTSVNIKNKRNLVSNDGYTSDICKSITDTYDKSNKYDGYISAPENNYRKPVQIVRGTVRQKEMDKKFDEVVKEHFNEKLEGNTSFETNNESSTDHISTSVLYNKNIQATSDVNTNSLRESSVDGPPSTVTDCIRESSVDGPAVREKENGDDFCTKNETKEPKIKDLNHVITVSAVPNFSVTKKPPLRDFVSSPKIRQNSSRAANISNTKVYKGSSTSLDNLGFRTPQLQRSYSKDDTISLVSANESDAYDSDTTSYAASPSVTRRQSGRPARLRYRWSTVYEEDENKKDIKPDKNTNSKNKKKENAVVLDSEAKPARIIASPKKSSIKSPKTEKKILSPKTNKKLANSEELLSPKSRKRFALLSPKSERKQKNSSDKRMSGCSDASSGIGSNSSQSQTPSLHSGEEVKMDDTTIEKDTSSRSRLWLFGRHKSRKGRSSSGYMSDGHVTDSSARSSRRYRFFSRSKSSLYTDGHSSGYDTSITDGGMTSCAEDLTDNESVASTKKKRRFLGLRRRSTNDLSSTRGRVKKPMWFDSRRCQSDDEGVQIKVYEIDAPAQMNRRRCKSEDAMTSRIQPRRIEELKKHREYLKSELHLALDKFPSIEYNAQLAKLNLDITDAPDVTNRNQTKSVSELEKENNMIGKKLKVLKSHIQVVTCFDAHQPRKVTQI
ncbi:kinesin-related protein 10-like isoform X1 [Hydractinia symbiolongicarpus]|uniref:kinesin-related protein 10-like isoform X1 n=1 Tax=Hydractinia symbiolongicarpus TaxID=13093 RepID=UPI00254FAE4F|nr:kinesin-related protein 10-like isoform X1 [Hydractinia symbiolongicarpus]